MENLNNNVPSGLPAVDSGNYISAQKYAFIFCDTKRKSEKMSDDKDKVIAAMQEQPSTAKVILSISAVIVAIVLGFVEGYNLSASLASALGINETLAFWCGTVFALIGILVGELLSGLKKDPFTNKYRYTARWYLGLFLAIAYLCMQYIFSAVASGDGAGLMPVFVLLIGFIEILVGVLFTKSALIMLGVIATNIKLKFLRRKLKYTSRRTEEKFQRHMFEVQTHNHRTGASVPHGIETDAIKEARAYYNSGGETGNI